MDRRDAIRTLVSALVIPQGVARQRSDVVTSASDARPSAAAERLAAAVRIPTVSHDGAIDLGPLLALHALFRDAFPRVHRTLAVEVVSRGSLLYTWGGSEPALRPILLSAHLDVVPAEADAAARWTHPPFGGRIADGYIWGRGTLDDKAAALGILEAVEALLAGGFRPRRTVHLAFGHDEEIGGREGAGAIAARLSARGVRIGWLLDEGLAVTNGLVPGVRRPVALIGVAEKGRLELELVATGASGHAAMPPAVTAIGRLGDALARLAQNPLPAVLSGPARGLLEAVAPELPLGGRLAIEHLWLTEPLLRWRLAAAPATAPLVRTTATVTRLVAGDARNVVPVEARATVDVRLRPGDTVAAALEHVRRIAGVPGVEIRVQEQREASPVAETRSDGYQAIGTAIRHVFPDAVVAPGLVLAATDARHYRSLADAAYGFVPIRFGSADVGRVHGVDERIAVTDYADTIRFYTALLEGGSMAPSRPFGVGP